MSASIQTAGGTPVPTNPKPRYGTIAARIGAQFEHKLEQDLTLPSGRLLKKGGKIHLTVDDITRLAADEVEHVKWMCRHPQCAHKRYPNKGQLLRDHPGNRDLEKAEETHLYVGVAWLPGVEAQPAKTDKTGAIVQEAIEARPARLRLLSDEE